MKRFAVKLLRNYAMAVIFISIFYRLIDVSETLPISLFFELLVILFAAELLELPISKIASDFRYPILGHLLKIISSATVFLIGAMLVWIRDAFVLLFIVIAVSMTYVIECFLDFRKANQDIAYINEQLKQRRDKKK